MRIRYAALGWWFVSISLFSAVPARLPAAEECNAEFDGTYALIQEAIFENRGCTEQLCHGALAQGDLDLRSEVSHANLIDRPSTSAPGWLLVIPGQKDQSLLWRKLAAKTLPVQWTAPGRPMPLDPLPPISLDELDALRKWIEYGAPLEGTVPGTGELLDACLPPSKPIDIAPLPPPAPGEGVQIHMPRWVLPPNSEDEVCYAGYYDVTDQVPPEFVDPTGTKFRINGSRIRQDPLSHHLITFFYEGESAPGDPVWGAYSCRGGPQDGQSCNPTDLGFCGAGYGCATTPVSRVACIGYGPSDAAVGFGSFGITGIQETAQEVIFPEGVYYELPLKATILFNSHAFNLTDTAGKLEAWMNFYFAPVQEHEVERIFDVTQIFKMNVPAFGTEEVCAFYRFRPNTHLFEISSHMHKRGKRFRIWEGAFACDGGPSNGSPCSPLGPDFASPDLCAGAPCRATRIRRAGDCDRDGSVVIDEVVLGVRIGLGEESVDRCPDADTNRDGRVAVGELVQAVDAAMHGTAEVVERTPEESLLYLSLLYNDPVIMNFDPAKVFPGPGSPLAERTFTYCALYDNGFTDPGEVKRRSTSPDRPGGVGGLLGGPCRLPTHCADGMVGAPCQGQSDEERDRSCDSAPEAGDGSCDACTLLGGVTTEDEMFAFFGAFYVP